MSMNISSQLISKLGSGNSKIPLAVKDVFNCAGYAYYSYDAGGKVECKDRLVDEVGTGLIWLFGIPTYKKLIDNTLYKLAKISPDVDVRILKNENYLKSAIENAPTEQVVNELKNAAKNLPKTKALTIAKFVMSLGLTLASYSLLTKFKQSMTKKAIEKEFKEEQKAKTKNQKSQPNFGKSPVFAEFENKVATNNPSFGSRALINIAEDIMMNPIKNMVVLDAGISGSRIANSRNKGEFKELAIKEGSFLFFVYGAGKLIEKGINKLSEKLFNAPITLDAKFLSSKTAESVLNNANSQKEISDFAKMLIDNADEKEIYDFIFKNPNNSVVKIAKKCGIISTIKDSSGVTKIDTRKYIDLKEMKKMIKNVQTFIEKGNGKEIGKYLNKVKSLKVASTILNLAACCLALGVAVPKMMYKYRTKNQNGKNDFHVMTEYKKELEQKAL